MLRIVELIWDDWNESHIARHNVNSGEVEEVCFGRSLGVRIRRDMYRLIGQTNAGRYIVVIVVERRTGWFYVVTARGASDAERRRFRSWREG